MCAIECFRALYERYQGCPDFVSVGLGEVGSIIIENLKPVGVCLCLLFCLLNQKKLIGG